ncbi:MAG TPA: type II toxin-antitoxin system Phd/YefM family antitoxin [Gemmatimonadota bacterium]|nr:type II toxin-antitoxin system Phd/YefM family antitoxin [Gemmatimonadota bacterium]
MKSLTATEARKTLYRLIDEVTVTSEPIQISGKRSSAILIARDDWEALQETVHLLSIPGLRESIREGLETPLEECVEELDW